MTTSCLSSGTISGFDCLPIDLLPAAVYICDRSGVILRYNRRAVELWGREPHCGDTIERLFEAFKFSRLDGTWMPHSQTPMAEALATGTPQHDREAIIERPDGSRIALLENIDPIRDDTGQVIGAVNLVQDITEQRRAQETLAHLAALVEHSDDAIIGKTLDGIITSWNRGAERLYGYTADEIVGHSIAILVPPDRMDEVPDILDRLRRGEPIDRYETERRRKDSAIICVSLTISPIRDMTGKLVGASTIARDVTDRMRLEERLQKSEERYRLAAAAAHSLIYDWDVETGRVERSDRLITLLGDRPEDLLATSDTWEERIHPEDRQQCRELVRTQLETQNKYSMEYRVRHRDGTYLHVWDQGVILRDAAGRARRVVGSTLDITQRRQVEQALRESEERFRIALRHSPITVATCDRELRYTWIYNPPVPFTVEQCLGKLDDQIAPPEYAADLIALKQAVLESGQGDRREIPIGVQGEVRHYDVTVEPLRDQHGQLVGVTIAAMDVTERKRLEEELQRRAEALAEADRSKDEFIAMLAHELRNPLAPIRNAAQLLRLTPPEPRLTRNLEVIERQVRHLARLLDDLLDASRIARQMVTLRRTRLDLVQLVRETVEDCRSVVNQAGLSLSLDLPEEPIWTEGDPTRLAQVVSNLLTNATKFTDSGGQVTVRMRLDAELGLASMTVRDTGIGIEPELLGRIFHTFSQADRSRERSRGGLGLGLALVKGLVELHGGEVRAVSEGPGRGAEFTVLLPVDRRPAATAITPVAPTPLATPIRVLVVEDNRDAADTLRELLELSGCAVEVAYTGPTAVEVARQFRPEVVLGDLGLPGMDGYEVAAVLRQDPLTAAARLIAVSGYGGEEDLRRSREAGFDFHLTKPVDWDELQRLLKIAAQHAQL